MLGKEKGRFPYKNFYKISFKVYLGKDQEQEYSTALLCKKKKQLLKAIKKIHCEANCTWL